MREREENTFLFVFPPNVHLIPKEDFETRYSICRFSRLVRIIGTLEVNLEITDNIDFCFSSSCFDNIAFCFSTT